jgi:hypothetical protein
MPSTLKTLPQKGLLGRYACRLERAAISAYSSAAWGRDGRIRYEVSNSILHTRPARVGRVSGIRQIQSRLLTTDWSARSPWCLALKD